MVGDGDGGRGGAPVATEADAEGVSVWTVVGFKARRFDGLPLGFGFAGISLVIAQGPRFFFVRL